MNVPFRSELKPAGGFAWLPVMAMMLFLTFTALVLPPWLSMPCTPVPPRLLPLIVLLVTFTVTGSLLAMKMPSRLLPLIVLLVMFNVIAMPLPAGALIRFQMPRPPLPLMVLLVTVTVIVLVAKEENLLNMPLADWLLLELVLPLMVLLVTVSVADVPFAWGSFKMPPPSLLLTVLPVTLTVPLLLEIPPPDPAPLELPVTMLLVTFSMPALSMWM